VQRSPGPARVSVAWISARDWDIPLFSGKRGKAMTEVGTTALRFRNIAAY